MKILHIGDVAGVPQNIAQVQRELGYESDVLSYKKHPFGYKTDFYYPIKSKFPYHYVKRFFIFLKLFNNYDVYHFHGGTLLPKGIDSILWKVLKKKLIVHHHGSELRFKGEKYIYSKFADRILVSTPDLLEWSPNGIWIPNPVDIRKYKFVEPNLQTHKLRILHAPSSRKIKGTEYVMQAIDKLKKDGYDTEFILLENVSHDEVIRQLKTVDIVIDWINPNFGIYGVFSIEAMCMGKPVLCYIRKDLMDKYYHNLPILNTGPESIYENIIKLIENPQQRVELGIKSRQYVEEIHDSSVIVKRLIEIYTDGTHFS